MSTQTFATISDLVEQVQTQPARANELRQQAYTNLLASNDQYQAYREHREPNDSASYPAGLLNGISVSAKDLYGVSGMATYGGTPYAFDKFADSGPLVQALIDQGAYVTGKTHTVEFAFGGLGTNPHWPVPRNPADMAEHRVPGGSSSGAPVSLLTDTCQLALGTDTSGSVRVPAAMCGTFGIKTSSGRWSKEQVVPLSPSIDTAGLLARTAADALWGFAVMDPASHDNPRQLVESIQQQAKASIKGVKIGLIPEYFTACEDGIDQQVMAAVKQLEAAGAEIVELQWPDLDESWQLFLSGGLSAVEFPEFIFAPENQQWFDALADTTKMRFLHLQGTAPEVFQQRIKELNQQVAKMQQAAHECLAQVDLAICPTVPISAPPLAQVTTSLEAYKDRNLKALSQTQLANYQNLCAATLPVGLNAAGLPCGMQIIMPHGEDVALMQRSCQLERILNA